MMAMLILVSTVAAFPYTVETNDLGLVTIDIDENWIQGGELAVVATPTTVEPGQQVTANLYLEIPYCDSVSPWPGKTGIIETDFTLGNRVVYRATSQNRCSASAFSCNNIACGQSVHLTAKFTPTASGDWGIRYRVYTNANTLLDQDATSFYVREVVTTCPNDDHYGSWQLTYDVTHGEYQSRAYYVVGNPPTCQESISKWERRTYCDSGYVIQGTTSRYAEGLHNCVLPTQQCTPTWTCGDYGDCVNELERRICSDGCGNTREETQSCAIQCTPDWSCSDWTSCYNEEKTRFCEDGCGGERPETETCIVIDPNTCTEDITLYCPSGQTIVTQRCVNGDLLQTGAQCQDNICNQDSVCNADSGETYYNCANDCDAPVQDTCPKYYYLEGENCKLDMQLWMANVGNYIIIGVIVLLLVGLGGFIYYKRK